MKLWLISSGFCEYETYSDAVVAASTRKKASEIHPDGDSSDHGSTWVRPENVTVEFLGEAKPGTRSGVICASFQAG